MMKKIYTLIAVLLLCSCVNSLQEERYLCPNVQIPRGTAYITQKVNYSEDVQIEVIGFEGYCTREENINRHYAMIKPLFKVQRLRDGYNTRVDFPFFTEATKGPPQFLGRKNYSASVTIGREEFSKEFYGQPVKVRIPNENQNDFEILLGINPSRAEEIYNQKTFDIQYRYLSAEELKKATSIRVQEVDVSDADEDETPVQYIPIKSEPVRAAPAKKSGCSGCDL